MIRWRALFLLTVFGVALPALSADASPSRSDLLTRTRAQVSNFVKVLSDVRCTEEVSQIRFARNGKVEQQAKSVYDYLIIATQTGSELALQESRLEQKAAATKPGTSLLVTNGFATLLLVFHPMYADSFEFAAPETVTLDGQTLDRIDFRHRANKPSTMELVLRGREYPLDLQGRAWIDPASGSIVRIDAELTHRMDDLGLRVLRTSVDYAPVGLRGVESGIRLPSAATIEVETGRQHWRNVHRFRGYQQFTVDAEENVRASK